MWRTAGELHGKSHASAVAPTVGASGMPKRREGVVYCRESQERYNFSSARTSHWLPLVPPHGHE